MNYSYPATAPRWGVFEVTMPGRTEGNPFTDYTITATFTGKEGNVTVDGFYDGDGVYKARFMPSYEGEYTFKVTGTFSDTEYTGSFTATAPEAGNHGPVRVNGFHFAYEDGTPYFSVGTTAYVWPLQWEEMVQKTLEELSKGYFNKIRFCVFPKHYIYNLHEPTSYPYVGTPCPAPTSINYGNPAALFGVQPGNDWDFYRFNPAHFQQIERCIKACGDLGVEADLIVMHPYDRWGFSHMAPDQDDLYWKYVIARFAAYHNVWWSLANEYDLLRDKTIADWERYASIILEKDPYRHLRGIHHCTTPYDHNRPWITHVSYQRIDLYKCAELVDQYRVQYQKPIVLDEIAYEGNIDSGWGNITGQEMVRRFWECSLRGGYAGHGETMDVPEADGKLWWSHGGPLRGESPARIRFLHQILCETPGAGLKYQQMSWDSVCGVPEETRGPARYLIEYYGFGRPNKRTFRMPEGVKYKVEIIDTWDMTITDAGVHEGFFVIPMPSKQYMAVRLIAVD